LVGEPEIELELLAVLILRILIGRLRLDALLLEDLLSELLRLHADGSLELAVALEDLDSRLPLELAGWVELRIVVLILVFFPFLALLAFLLLTFFVFVRSLLGIGFLAVL